MTGDEYARLEKATGDPVMNINGTWWQKVRPFFYRPLIPFTQLNPREVRSGFTMLQGFQHCVPSDQPSNSFLNLLVFEKIQDYTIMSLNKQSRQKLKKSMKQHITISRFTDPEEFIARAYPIYLSFYQRTRFSYRKDRTDRDKFADWSQILFEFPGVVIKGAFLNDTLLSIDISCLVEDILILKDSINSQESLKVRAPELLLHHSRESAAKREDIKMIYTGYLSKEKSINQFKIQRGVRILSLPSYLHLHPALLRVIRMLNKDKYFLLKGRNEDQLRQEFSRGIPSR